MTKKQRTKNCIHCNEEFTEKAYESNKAWSEKKFCNRDCHYDHQRKERVEKECPVCGDDFEVYKNKEERRTFCSNECYSKDLSNNSDKYSSLFEEGHEGYDSSPWEGKTFSDEHRQAISEALTGIKRSDEYIEENLSGESHWNWQGGKSFTEYPSSFNPTLKKEIRERDGFECVNCGMSQEDCVEEHGKKLAVHHIDGDKSNLSRENLVSLCTSCHVNHHNSSLNLDIGNNFKNLEA